MYQGKENALVNARCPYFIRDSRKTITCEGIIGGALTQMVFETEAKKDAHIRNECIRYPDCECTVRFALDKKYK